MGTKSADPLEASKLRLADENARIRALDPRGSFIVQAPAGSGKTELLTHRFLELLARVDEPEQILAITFTRAATAEMRSRVLRALEQARGMEPSRKENASRLAQAARAALATDARRDWKLLEQPQRLNIQTIDSLCLSIAQQTPLLSRLGGSPAPVEDAAPLYAEAARRTLAHLGGADDDLNLAIGSLLELRETSLSDCERLIAGMLAQRDQWGRALPLGPNPDWQRIREMLETPFLEERRRVIGRARALFAQDQAAAAEIFLLLQYACGNLKAAGGLSPVLALDGVSRVEEMTEHCHWAGLCEFLLTQQDGLRKAVNGGIGFPAIGTGSGSAERRRQNERFRTLLAALSKRPELLEQLCELRGLPPPAYSPEHWRMLSHVLIVLRRAIAELRVIFAEQNQLDFVELGLAAAEVLRNETDRLPADLAARWPHLLVDEFQDTSRAQYDLFSLLVEAREQPGTCFFVGDPMQSIYGFRQAEVELFEGARRNGLGENPPRFPLTPLGLRLNFRSHAGLVAPLNGIFREIFAAVRPPEGYAVAFAPSVASEAAPGGAPSVHGVARFLRAGASPEEKRAARHEEAANAVEIIREHWSQVEAAAQAGEAFRIAVLARAKKHLWLIAEKLREAGIPYRAVEIEKLGERQEVLDAAALVRALAHPMDRIAWLSVLRAPWCGLTLQDLHILCGSDDPQLAARPVLELLRMRIGLLSSDGEPRAARTAAVLEAALRGKHRQMSFAHWVERTWLTLGGGECVDRAEYQNVRAFFRMLETGGPEELDRNLARLFAAPNPGASECNGVQLMTIHKAKGLEFEVVLVPGLHESTEHGGSPLLTWLERTTLEGPEETERHEFLVAPIGRKDAEGDPLYRWIQKQKQSRERQEAKRLLYVACTRASRELYLLGAATVAVDAGGAESLKPGQDQSLLATAWPGVKSLFLAEYERQKSEEKSGAAAGKAPPAAGSLNRSRDRSEDRSEDGECPGHAAALQQLRRLPLEWRYPEREDLAMSSSILPAESASPDDFAFGRPAGSLEARAVGAVVHALLEELARLAGSMDEVAGGMDRWRPRAIAMLRQDGLSRAEAERQSAKVVLALKGALEDPVGRWILSSRSEAETETSWSAWQAEQPGLETLATRRADRIFRAGEPPDPSQTLAPGQSPPGQAPFIQTKQPREATYLWIVDYKTAQHSGAGLDAFLDAEKAQYKPQLELYGRMMREAGGGTLPLRLALYYPLLKRLVWWEG